jgi:hypothetical protein
MTLRKAEISRARLRREWRHHVALSPDNRGAPAFTHWTSRSPRASQ